MRTPIEETPTAAPRERKRKEQAVATAWSAAETLETVERREGGGC